MKELINCVEVWAADRNLIEGSTPQKQFIKLMEEFGELCSGISKGNKEMITDAIGDCFVVITILSKQKGYDLRNMFRKEIEPYDCCDYTAIFRMTRDIHNYMRSSMPTHALFESLSNIFSGLVTICKNHDLDFKYCINSAWDEIKDRKGKMINGVFVKESDL